MCKLCDDGRPHRHAPDRGLSRRGFLGANAAALAGGALLASAPRAARAQGAEEPPADTGTPGRRWLLKDGAVLTMDPQVGDFERADVLIEGRTIVAVGVDLRVMSDVTIVDAANTIVMPGFVDTHHHQFETALRGTLPEGLLVNDGLPHGQKNYMDFMLGRLAPAYRPEDVYISELVASLSQLDAGVTTTVDISQISHTPEHSDAAIRALQESGRRAVYAYAAGVGPDMQFPRDLLRLKQQYFASSDQLLTLALNGELFDPNWRDAWALAREAGVPITSHILGWFGLPTLELLAQEGLLGPDNTYIHATRIGAADWQAIAATGGGVSIAVPIEMVMRHGMPPLQEALDHGIQPSLSVDVECTMTADFFTQMRSAFTLQRALVNERAFAGEENLPALLTCRDVIRFATVEGARVAHLDDKIGTLTPGKEADLILLRTDSLNVMPLNNVPAAVVTLMDRSNVDTVVVAGRIVKWRGQMLGIDPASLRADLEASRDYLLTTVGEPRQLF